MAGKVTSTMSGIWKYRYTMTRPQNERTVSPWAWRSSPLDLRILVIRPWVPSAAMNANANGMPPKLAATPLNAVTPLRSHFGRRSVAAAYANRTPMTAPSSAVTNDSLSDAMNAS